jgi:hypothetical protein
MVALAGIERANRQFRRVRFVLSLCKHVRLVWRRPRRRRSGFLTWSPGGLPAGSQALRGQRQWGQAGFRGLGRTRCAYIMVMSECRRDIGRQAPLMMEQHPVVHFGGAEGAGISGFGREVALRLTGNRGTSAGYGEL